MPQCQFHPDPHNAAFFVCTICGLPWEDRYRRGKPPIRACKGPQAASAVQQKVAAAQAAAAKLGWAWDDARRYMRALAAWTRAGCPTRTDAEVERCLQRCYQCPFWRDEGRCAACRCRINRGPALFNKIRMASEDCPKGFWRGAGETFEVKQPDNRIAEPAQSPKPQISTSQNTPIPAAARDPRKARAWRLMRERRPRRFGPIARMLAARDAKPPEVVGWIPPIPGKIDVVYPIGDGSIWDNNELRYSIRSVEKNFLDLGRIWIVGRKPDWLTGVCWIPMEDVHKHNKDANLIDKVLAACRAGVTEQFVFCSDDQIFLKPIRFSEMRALHYGDLTGRDKWASGSWWRRLRATRDVLLGRGLSTVKNFDSHCPTPYNREKFMALMPTFDYAPPPGFTINTLYCCAAGVDGEKVGRKKVTAEAKQNDADKIREGMNGRWYLGYNDGGLTDGLKKVLAEMFGEVAAPAQQQPFPHHGNPPRPWIYWSSYENDWRKFLPDAPVEQEEIYARMRKTGKYRQLVDDASHEKRKRVMRLMQMLDKEHGVKMLSPNPSEPKTQVADTMLVFHFAPWLRRPEMIEFHLERLSWYLPQFAKVRMNLVVGEEFASPDEIENRLRPHISTSDVKFIRSPNGRDGEVTPFFSRLLPDVSPDDYAFYGHSKAAMNTGLPNGALWAEMMYAQLFSCVREVVALLDQHPCVGPAFDAKAKRGAFWRYCGTFFAWKNHRQWPNWHVHMRDRYAVENWLGRFIPAEKAYRLSEWAFYRGVCQKNRFGALNRWKDIENPQ